MCPGCIWSRFGKIDFWSFFGHFWSPQNCLGWPAGWSGSKGTPFENALLKTLFCKIWFQFSPISKIFELPEFFCNSWSSHKFEPKRWRFRWKILMRANGRIWCARARGRLFFLAKNTKIDFATYMNSKLFILLSTPPFSGSADSVLAIKNVFETI